MTPLPPSATPSEPLSSRSSNSCIFFLSCLCIQKLCTVLVNGEVLLAGQLFAFERKSFGVSLYYTYIHCYAMNASVSVLKASHATNDSHLF